jgi:hypothetical protein
MDEGNSGHGGRHGQRLTRKELVKGLAGGCGLLLFTAAIIAGAVLWRASWYFG